MNHKLKKFNIIDQLYCVQNFNVVLTKIRALCGLWQSQAWTQHLISDSLSKHHFTLGVELYDSM